MIPQWLTAWRALTPHLTTRALEALERACETDSGELVQGVTCVPSIMQCPGGTVPCQACLIGYAGWRGEGLETIGEIEDYFARMTWKIDDTIGKTCSRWLTCWFDETPRAEVFAALLPEIRAELFRRGSMVHSERTVTT